MGASRGMPELTKRAGSVSDGKAAVAYASGSFGFTRRLSLHLDHLNAHLASDARDRQQRRQRLNILPAVIGDFEMSRADMSVAQHSVEHQPLALDPYFGPHVKGQSGTELAV